MLEHEEQQADVEPRHGNGTHHSVAGDDDHSLVGLALEQLALEAERIGAVARLAVAEAKLSLVGAGTVLIGALIAAALALTAWGLLIAAGALWLRSTGLPIEVILIGLAAVHGVGVWVLVTGLRGIGREIGFSELERQLGKQQ